jgi:hypothetical protein
MSYPWPVDYVMRSPVVGKALAKGEGYEARTVCKEVQVYMASCVLLESEAETQSRRLSKKQIAIPSNSFV